MGSQAERTCGKVTAGRPHKVGASRPHSPTFAHRYTRRNGRGAKQTMQPRALARGNKASNL